MTYHFIVTGWNCEAWAERCLRSLFAQKVPAGCSVHFFVVDDGSDDDTTGIVREHILRGDLTADRTESNQGAAWSRYYALNHCGARPDDVVVLVDLDDYLPTTHALLRVHEEYVKGAEVTYGSFDTFDPAGRRLLSPMKAYPPGVVRKRSYRRAPWHCWPLRTFRYGLWAGPDYQAPPARYFRGPDGEWLMKGTDLALMFCVLERARPEAVRYVDEVLYTYNSTHPNVSLRRHGGAYKERAIAHVRSLPPLVPIHETAST